VALSAARFTSSHGVWNWSAISFAAAIVARLLLFSRTLTTSPAGQRPDRREIVGVGVHTLFTQPQSSFHAGTTACSSAVTKTEA